MTISNFPFAKMDIAVINDSALSAQAKVLFGILASLSQRPQSAPFPFCQVTIEQLGNLMNRTDRTIQTYLNELIIRGVIVRIPQFISRQDGTRWQTASRFVLLGSHSAVYPEDAREGFYFAMVSSSVLTDPSLTINEKLLFVVLCSMADITDDTINTYARTLATRMNISVSSIYKCIATLRKKDILTVIPHFVGHTLGHSASTYIVNRDIDVPYTTISDLPSESTSESIAEPTGADFKKYLLSEIAGQELRTYYSNNLTKANNFVAKNGESTPYSNNSIINQDNPLINSKNYPKNIMTPIKATRISPTDPRIPEVMSSVVNHLLEVTGRTTLFESELEYILKLEQRDTPIRICEEISRAGSRFIAQKRPLSNLCFQYIFASLKRQTPTYQPNAGAVAKALKTIAQDRTIERQRRTDLLNRRYSPSTCAKNDSGTSNSNLNWTNPVPESRLSESEAQTVIVELKDNPVFQETNKLVRALTTKIQQSHSTPVNNDTLVPVFNHVLTSPVSREQVLDYLQSAFDIDKINSEYQSIPHLPATDIEQILTNTLEDMSPEKAQSWLDRAWKAKTQSCSASCENCSSLASCPSQGLKYTLFCGLTGFSGTPNRKLIFRISSEKCAVQLEQEKYAQSCQRFATLLKASGLTPDQYSHTLDTIDTSVHTEVTTAVATAIRSTQNGQWLALLGHSGSGKTRIATGLALSLMAQGRPAILVNASDMLSNLLNFDNKANLVFEKKYKEIALLVIDEADKLTSSDKIAKYIFEVMDYRYKNHLQTILISNKSLEGLIRLNRTLFEPVLSRFAERGLSCSLFHTPDYRTLIQQRDQQGQQEQRILIPPTQSAAD